LFYGEKVSGGFLEPVRQPSYVYHFTDEALDNISLGIEIGIAMCFGASPLLDRESWTKPLSSTPHQSQ